MKKTYSYEEAIAAAKEYFGGDLMAAEHWVKNYALRDTQGEYLENSPSDMHHRIAKELARIENQYPNAISEDIIFSLLDGFKYLIPLGNAMNNIGNESSLSPLSEAFAIGLEEHADSYGGILKIDEEQVQLMKRGAGVAEDLSHIRPRGTTVQNVAQKSTGSLLFMERYCCSSREVMQDKQNKLLQLSLSITHPDSQAFMTASKSCSLSAEANTSIWLTDTFMESVKNETDYKLQYPINGNSPLQEKKISATELWGTLSRAIYEDAKPNVLFQDHIINQSVTDAYKEYGFGTISVSPQGDTPLAAYDGARKLAINLYSYVDNPFTSIASFNLALFSHHVSIAQRLLDDIVDLELEKIDKIIAKIKQDPEPLELKQTELQLWEKIKEKTAKGRRIGLGITALADTIAALGLRYTGQEALTFSNKLQKTLAEEAYRSSVHLAEERGVFPLYDEEKERNVPFIQSLRKENDALYEEMRKKGRRNIACLSGSSSRTLSLFTQSRSGIEPIRETAIKRRKKIAEGDKTTKADWIDELGNAWIEEISFYPRFRDWMNVMGYDLEKKYSQDELDNLFHVSPYFTATQKDINWELFLELQGQMQKWTDQELSSVIYLPKSCDRSDIKKILMKAWETGCKICKIYREGAASEQSNSEEAGAAENKLSNKNNNPEPISRPKELEADIVRFQNNKEKWVAFVGLRDGKPYEIFTGIADDDEGIMVPKSVSRGKIIKSYDDDGRKHYDFQFHNRRGFKMTIEGLDSKFNPEFWNYAKLISGVLRYGMPIDQVINLVQGMDLDDENINSWKTGVERALKKYLDNGQKANGQKCSQCGQESLIYQDGCLVCCTCGVSRKT